MQLGAQLLRPEVLALLDWSAVSASTGAWPGCCLALAARVWRATSKGVEKRFAWPAMCATSWRTSHSVQSVGRVQSPGRSASTASVTR